MNEMMPVAYRLILASRSPQRQELLRQAGLEFDVVEPPIAEPDESCAGLSPARQAEALAYFKARAVADMCRQATVMAADTIVSVGGKLLGKPADQDEARAMLRSFSGTRHQVITGVAIIGPQGQRLIASETTYVTMRRMSDQEIESYIGSGEWVGKAGSYAIQATADRFVEAVDGSFTNVVGLPMELLTRMLDELKDHPGAHHAI